MKARASVELADDGKRHRWSVEPSDRAGEYGVRVNASISSIPSSVPCKPIGGTCLSAAVGISPDHHGIFEAARMEPDHRRAQQVEINHLDSAFLACFTSAQPAPSYVMRDIDVRWTKMRAPQLAPTEALT